MNLKNKFHSSRLQEFGRDEFQALLNGANTFNSEIGLKPLASTVERN